MSRGAARVESLRMTPALPPRMDAADRAGLLKQLLQQFEAGDAAGVEEAMQQIETAIAAFRDRQEFWQGELDGEQLAAMTKVRGVSGIV